MMLRTFSQLVRAASEPRVSSLGTALCFRPLLLNRGATMINGREVKVMGGEGTTRRRSYQIPTINEHDFLTMINYMIDFSYLKSLPIYMDSLYILGIMDCAT